MSQDPPSSEARRPPSAYPRVIVLTAILLEFKAVVAHLINTYEYCGASPYICDCGEFLGESQNWDVIVAETGPGNTPAAIAATKLIDHFKPDLMIFVGIAGSLKSDLKIGDVVASRRVYFYEGGKAEHESFASRPQSVSTPLSLVQRAQAVARKDDWRLRIKGLSETNPTNIPKAVVGPIAAGEILGAHPDSPEVKWIMANYNDALVMEMEGYGAMSGADTSGINAIVIRAVSDRLANKGATDAAGGQELAVANASAFAFEFLSKLTVVSKHESPLIALTKKTVAALQPKDSATHPEETEAAKNWVIKLNGKLDQVGTDQRAQLLRDLRTLSGDQDLQINKIEPGSIVVYLSSKSKLFERLSKTQTDEELPVLGGFKVIAILDADSHALVSRIVTSFKAASEDLLSWPTTLGDHQWLRRRELTQLDDLLRTPNASKSLLIGDPGTGKSAILSKLAQQYTDQGTPTLAIKADYLFPEIRSLDDLGKALNLPLPPDECIRVLSQHGNVIVIVDQLDALADLVDLHSERLNVLLTLIRCIAQLPNVHLVASCRRFEFNHDIRLTSIEADLVALSLPDWQDVNQVLSLRSIDASNWPEPARNLLLIPLHLKIFLNLLEGTTEARIIDSYHALFEQLWAQRVLNPTGSHGRSLLLTKMAIEMADKETLWLPTAKFDPEFMQVMELERAGVLCRTPDGSRVGFSHQKLFEFARARAFAQTGESLSRYALERQDGLFVRPKLWTSLFYLRSADRNSFLREFNILWSTPDLRLHLRHLLIEFLAELDDPGTQEVTWLFTYLDKPEFHIKILSAIPGRKSWFHELKKTRLSVLMKLREPDVFNVVRVLGGAWSFAYAEVLDSVKILWLPDPSYDQYTFEVLRYLEKWDEDAVKVLCTVISRTDFSATFVSMIGSTVSQSSAELAPRVVAAKLNRDLKNAQALDQRPFEVPIPAQEVDQENAMVREDARRTRYSALLEISRDWWGLPEIATAAPASFLNHVWPWFVSVSSLVAVGQGVLWRFRDDWSLATNLLGDRDADVDYPVVSSVEKAVLQLAKNSPEDFFTLLRGSQEEDTLVVQRLLARGLTELGNSHPQDGLQFLLGDPRRLCLGSHRDSHSDTVALISSIAPHLSKDEINKIEHYVLQWLPHGQSNENEAPTVRLDRMKWDRTARTRLLRCLPIDRLSHASRDLIGEEERAWQGVLLQEAMSEGASFIGSPMSVAQMIVARDEDVIGLFTMLEDKTGWDHPKHLMKGGSIQASREFAELVKQFPDRGLSLIAKMSPGSQERPVAYALEALASTEYPFAKLHSLIVNLFERGFNSQEFKTIAASVFGKTAPDGEGLPDNICNLLEVWLEGPWPIDERETLPTTGEDYSKSSIMWGHRGFWTIPKGSYTVLEAIFKGLMFRRPMDADRWLRVLEKHLLRAESLETWNAVMASHLKYLVNASDRKAAVQFLDDLFHKFPALLSGPNGVILLGSVRGWLPSEMLNRFLLEIRDSDWTFGAQAYGELLLLSSLSLQNETLQHLLELALSPTSSDIDARQVLIGIAHSAAALWPDPRFRNESTKVLIRLTQESDSAVAHAVMSIFWRCEELPSGEATNSILKAIAEHPPVLKNVDPSYLVSRIQDLVFSESNLVYKVSLKVLEQNGKSLVDLRSSYAFSSTDLINIALTLHRFETPEQRHNGLDLFEKLLALNVYGSRDALLEIDGRFVSLMPKPPRMRRRKKSAA